MRSKAVLLVVGVLLATSIAVVVGRHVYQGVAAAQAVAQAESGVQRAASRVQHERVAGQRVIVALPKHPNGGLVVYLHGAGQTEQAVTDDPETGGMTADLLRAGYVVAASRADGDAWGNLGSVSAYRALIQTVSQRQRTRRTFLLSESMGGLTARQLVNLPSVRAWAAWYPVCDLRSLYGSWFRSQINSAYGGHPTQAFGELSAMTARAKVPVLFWASPDDQVVSKDRNADACAAAIRRHGGTAMVISTSGNHGDPSNFQPQRLLAFFRSA